VSFCFLPLDGVLSRAAIFQVMPQRHLGTGLYNLCRNFRNFF
jgi:hypothetical protein